MGMETRTLLCSWRRIRGCQARNRGQESRSVDILARVAEWLRQKVRFRFWNRRDQETGLIDGRMAFSWSWSSSQEDCQ